MSKRVYLVMFDGENEVVEAEDFGSAIRIWRAHLIAENDPGDFDEHVEPESVSLLSGSPVLR